MAAMTIALLEVLAVEQALLPTFVFLTLPLEVLVNGFPAISFFQLE